MMLGSLGLIIGTASDLLSIIQYAIQFAKFVSPQVRRALESTERELSRAGSGLSTAEAEAVLLRKLREQLPDDRVQPALSDLTVVFELLQGASKSFSMYAEKGQLPDHAAILSGMISTLERKLWSWRCFPEWGIKLPYTRGPVPDHVRPADILLLPAEHLGKSLAHYKPISEVLDSGWRSASWCYSAHLTTRPCTGDPSFDVVLTRGGYATTRSYLGVDYQALNRINLLVGWDPGRVSLKFCCVKISDDECKVVRLQLSQDGFVSMASAILDDAVNYARRVRGEIESTGSFLDAARRRLLGKS